MRKNTKEKLSKIVAKNYSEIAEVFDLSRKKQVWPELERIAKDVFPGAKVLDAGCGNGRLLEVLQDKEIDYSGFDLSPELIELAKKNYPNHNFFVKDILQVEKIKDKYDFIFSIAVISHLPGKKERVKVLQSLAAKLKEEGRLIISVWDLYRQDKFKSIIFWSEIKRIFLFNGLEKGDLIFFWKNGKGEKVSKRYYHAFKSEEINYLIKESKLELEKKIEDGRKYLVNFKK